MASESNIVELRDSTDVRRYVLQGLRLRRLGSTSERDIALARRWLLELANADEVIPPACFISDVGWLTNGIETVAASTETATFPNDLARAYEDYVLGKLYADATFERGSTAVCRYAEKDQPRGTAWLIARFRDRAGAPGIRCSASAIRSLAKTPFEDLLAETAELIRDGLDPLLLEHVDALTQRVRNLGEVLAPEDVFELERGTALVEFGQRLALRQTLAASSELAQHVPRLVPVSFGRERSVTTKLFHEDSYPVGGFTSLSTRGSVESLLHSQLAFMEREEAERPDLFDIKYLRSELLYYSRDENEFMRRRRTIVFALSPDLVATRVKDPDADWQRIILVLGMLTTVTRQLIEWLSDEALVIRFSFTDDTKALAEESALLAMMFQEQVENGTVIVENLESSALMRLLTESARGSLTHAVSVACKPSEIAVDNVLATELAVAKPIPTVSWQSSPVETTEADAPWIAATNRLLRTLL